MKISKDKAILLIDEKISQFQKVLAEATYDDSYKEAYQLAYHGTEELLTELFSEKTTQKFRMSVTIPRITVLGGGTDYNEELRYYRNHINRCISQLKVFKEKIQNLWETSESETSVKSINKLGRDVFIVHGHDKATKEAVARFIEKLGLNPIILHEQPNEGRTIIEKFEDHSKVGFAIIIITPDDIGGPRTKTGKQKPRARQNVIFELGYFIGKLERSRVCALYVEGVEMPSDYDGVLYIPLDSQDAWQLRLAREIKQAGLPVDLNKIIGT